MAVADHVTGSDTAPTSGSAIVTPTTPTFKPGRAIRIDCTGTGVLVYVLNDTSVMTLHLTAGTPYEFNDAVVSITSYSGAGTIYILY